MAPKLPEARLRCKAAADSFKLSRIVDGFEQAPAVKERVKLYLWVDVVFGGWVHQVDLTRTTIGRNVPLAQRPEYEYENNTQYWIADANGLEHRQDIIAL